MPKPRTRLLLKTFLASLIMLAPPPVAHAQRRHGTQPPASAQGGSGATSETVATLLRDALELLRAGKHAEAEPLVRRAVAVQPSSADAHGLLGLVLDQSGKIREAEREYRAALRLNPRSVTARANLGVLLARGLRHAEAVRLFESVLADAPEHPQATLNLGAALFHLRRFDEAERILRAASGLLPRAAEPHYYRGQIAAARGRGEEAAGHWLRALELRENFPEASFTLAEELRRQRLYKRAAEFYGRALAGDSTKPVYHIRLGGALLLLVRYEEALAVFRRAAARFPESAEAHYFVGIAARGGGLYDEAGDAFRKMLSIKHDDVDGLAQLGFINGERGQFVEAERLLRRAIARGPGHFYAHYDLGRLLVKTRRYEEALPLLRRAAALKADNPDVHYQLFMALSRLGRKEEAEGEMTLFKKLDEERKRREKDGGGQHEYVQGLLPPPSTNHGPPTP